ncbi:glyoxalase/bleomycin resistance/dioxygenase family protein [Paracrocinitomix mangrovi]|uniref:VOC family protein n=1 Tax=Paracrocinitomix mangrovi TaxID=2862509 RepID=UPI001C8D0A6B|nr:glyoxalase/bleomycin resistance/dioxygenase family protein [Paracrocinitomix mangrovi]UKN03474.1 glyoxalase/bleomycin resistance/dioxygenase family protein [Paracrocinitomix mangrovi]
MINLIVIKTNKLEELKSQYEVLGLDFTYHNHGNGPFHYSTQLNGIVFEIYPLPQNLKEADNTTRLGFEVDQISKLISKLEKIGWKVISSPKESAWGIRAVIQDLDERKVELIEKRTLTQ